MSVYKANHTILHTPELVVNWHLTEACNYSCKYCYAAWTKPSESKAVWRSQSDSKQLLTAIKGYFDSNNKSNHPLTPQMTWNSLRLSFAGGEPMLLGKRFEQILNSAKTIGFHISLITNGSFLNDETLRWLSPKLSMLGISIDSNDDERNQLIGRADSKGNMISKLNLEDIIRKARFYNPNIIIKINTVINAANWNQDLSKTIDALNPERWKVLRVLPAVSKELTITDEQFQAFIHRNQEVKTLLTVEDNQYMQDSYIMIDPHGRFFQNTMAPHGGKEYIYSESILDVTIEKAFQQINFSVATYCSRYKSISPGLKESA